MLSCVDIVVLCDKSVVSGSGGSDCGAVAMFGGGGGTSKSPVICASRLSCSSCCSSAVMLRSKLCLKSFSDCCSDAGLESCWLLAAGGACSLLVVG